MSTDHVCACGERLPCHQEHDQCPHGPWWWTCDRCLEQQVDDYFRAVGHLLTTPRTEETADEPQQPHR